MCLAISQIRDFEFDPFRSFFGFFSNNIEFCAELFIGEYLFLQHLRSLRVTPEYLVDALFNLLKNPRTDIAVPEFVLCLAFKDRVFDSYCNRCGEPSRMSSPRYEA